MTLHDKRAWWETKIIVNQVKDKIGLTITHTDLNPGVDEMLLDKQQVDLLIETLKIMRKEL